MSVGYDILGNVAILKFDDSVSSIKKRKFAKEFLDNHKKVTTVLEKSGKFSGRLRTQKTTWLAGEKTKEVLYKENGCEFRLNIDTCYFSPRLSEERKEIANMLKKKEDVLVMFGGVAPFAIVAGKKRKHDLGKSKSHGKILSVELGRDCTRYAKINIRRNKLEDFIEVFGGDVRRVCPKLERKFDKIVMARPNLRDNFLDVAFPLIKPKGVIYYYGFCKEEILPEMKEMILIEAKLAKKKIKIMNVKRAGDIGPYAWRYRFDIKVLN